MLSEIDSTHYETVPLPTEKARNHDPIHLSFVSDYWANERLELKLFWNPGHKSYYLQLETTSSPLGTLIDWTPITLHRPYQYRDWLRVIFVAETESTDRLRPRRLGDTIECTIWPGPDNPDYEPYSVGPTEIWDPDNPPEPWKPPLDYEPGAPILS